VIGRLAVPCLTAWGSAQRPADDPLVAAAGMAVAEAGYAAGMSDQRSDELGSGQVDGPEEGAADNAAANASPDVAERVLGEHAHDGVTDADRDLEAEHHHRAPGDLHQPRTGAEQPFDAEDLVHARGQDATPATLRLAEQDLDAEGSEAIEHEVPTLDE
jgi:hypothetical protein